MIKGPIPPAAEPPSQNLPPRQLGLFFWLCLAAGAGSVGYRVLVLGQKEQSAMMFIGLPLAMALLLALLPQPKSATGTIMKGISLFLLLLGILFIEGFICILMAAPLFYSVGFIVGIFMDKARARREYEKRFRLVVLPALMLMSLEGVTGSLSFPRDETVVVSKETGLSPAEARARLARGPEFVLAELPGFLKLGFPAPHGIQGTGLEPGDTWQIHFAGGEGKPGDLLAKVTESSPERIVVACVSDSSHISHWMDWQDATWTIEPSAAGSRVTLSMHYRRLLDPAWYFKPAERYGVRKAGEYFLEQTYRTP
ncbi:hypothetical protein [Haloferula sp. BvORR071]|uniref:SRPBCC family protein n=1 Tax=Haloferula sp. BvORR071 TaxID=1396141 RepID=UPI002240F766|nr:hypothetical protein [Haloferula sp. BvORR071]